MESLAVIGVSVAVVNAASFISYVFYSSIRDRKARKSVTDKDTVDQAKILTKLARSDEFKEAKAAKDEIVRISDEYLINGEIGAKEDQKKFYAFERNVLDLLGELEFTYALTKSDTISKDLLKSLVGQSLLEIYKNILEPLVKVRRKEVENSNSTPNRDKWEGVLGLMKLFEEDKAPKGTPNRHKSTKFTHLRKFFNSKN